jgi:hypothetical protein
LEFVLAPYILRQSDPAVYGIDTGYALWNIKETLKYVIKVRLRVKLKRLLHRPLGRDGRAM